MPRLTVQLFFPLVARYLPPPIFLALRHLFVLALIAGVAWLVISASHVIYDALGVRYRLDVRDNLAARPLPVTYRVTARSMHLPAGLPEKKGKR